MAEKQNKNGKENKPCDPILARFNELVSKYGNLPSDSFLNAFARAGMGLENQPQIQNQRLKSISPLPLDISKDNLLNSRLISLAWENSHSISGKYI